MSGILGARGSGGWETSVSRRKANTRLEDLTGMVRIPFLTARTMESHQSVGSSRMRTIIVEFWKDHLAAARIQTEGSRVSSYKR